jgi:hypothetical protein
MILIIISEYLRSRGKYFVLTVVTESYQQAAILIKMTYFNPTLKRGVEICHREQLIVRNNKNFFITDLKIYNLTIEKK